MHETREQPAETMRRDGRMSRAAKRISRVANRAAARICTMDPAASIGGTTVEFFDGSRFDGLQRATLAYCAQSMSHADGLVAGRTRVRFTASGSITSNRRKA